MNGFLRVARIEDLAARPGGEVRVALLGRRILLRWGAGGELEALELACRHQNADLSSAAREGNVLTCPRHGWQYDLVSGACLNEPWAALRRFEVCSDEAGAIWISTAPLEGPSVEEPLRSR